MGLENTCCSVLNKCQEPTECSGVRLKVNPVSPCMYLACSGSQLSYYRDKADNCKITK